MSIADLSYKDHAVKNTRIWKLTKSMKNPLLLAGEWRDYESSIFFPYKFQSTVEISWRSMYNSIVQTSCTFCNLFNAFFFMLNPILVIDFCSSKSRSSHAFSILTKEFQCCHVPSTFINLQEVSTPHEFQFLGIHK